MSVAPYLMLDGRAEEAIDFYKQALGASVEMMMRFKDSPDKSMCAAGNENKVMHACIKIGDAPIMVSDGRNTGNPEFKGISLSVNAKDEAEADKLFAALGQSGQVQMAMTKTFFAKRFGMVADKFGISWMIIAE